MNLTLQTQSPALTLQATGQTLASSRHELVLAIAGVAGAKGADGDISISTDPNNRLTTGTDSGAFVPEWQGVDPLFYYTLAKN